MPIPQRIPQRRAREKVKREKSQVKKKQVTSKVKSKETPGYNHSSFIKHQLSFITHYSLLIAHYSLLGRDRNAILLGYWRSINWRFTNVVQEPATQKIQWIAGISSWIKSTSSVGIYYVYFIFSVFDVIIFNSSIILLIYYILCNSKFK